MGNLETKFSGWLKGFTDAGIVGSKNNCFNLTTLVIQIVTTLIFVGASAGLIFIAMSGFKLVASGGDTGKIAEARNRIILAAAGLVIVVAGYVIWEVVLKDMLGISEINPGKLGECT
jgi:hypothetical protein